MFQEALDFALLFIGIQPGDIGCSSVELSEFLLQDVSPYCGQAGNTTLRDTIMLLLLSPQQCNRFRVVRVPPLQQPKGRDRKGAKTADGLAALSAQMKSAVELSVPEVNGLFEADGIQWEEAEPHRTSPLLPTGETKERVMLRFVPGTPLRERSLGLSLHSETMLMTANYMCDHATQGWCGVRSTPETKGRYKGYLVLAGLRKLRQRHMVATCFGLETEPKVWLTSRVFPTFAFPLSEPEKAECCLQEETDTVGRLSKGAFESKNPLGEAGGSPPAVSATGLSPSEFAVYRGKRGNWPVHHYYARKRSRDAAVFPVVLDLGLVKSVVKTSPEGNLLYQDAVHAILAAHAVHDIDMPRRSIATMKKVMGAAGLRLVRASINVRGKPRSIKLVIPVEDLLRHIQRQRALERRLRHRHDDADSGEDEEGVITAGDKAIEWSDDSRHGSNADSDDDGGGEEDEEQAEEGTAGGRKEVKTDGAATGRGTGKQAAFAPFYTLPDFPIELQACDEAERRPLALTAVYPKAVFETPEKVRKATLSNAIEAFMKKYRTIESYSVVEKGKKAFSTVYTTRRGPDPRRDVVSAEPQDGSKEDTRDAATAGCEETRACDLPKGLSQYAVDTMMDVLASAPHHAATMNHLRTILDSSTLTRRLLPYLRSVGKILCTGVTLPGKRRVGIVALAGVKLTEKEKEALVVSERAALTAATLETTNAQELVRGSGSVRTPWELKTNLVLDEIPAVGEGVEPSRAAKQLTTVSGRTSNLISKVIMIRNGYARLSLCRAGRLHLELWKQWHDLAAAQRLGGLPPLRPEETYVSLQQVYDRMSLSTFCIVVGFSAFDLASVLGSVAAPTATEEEAHSRGGRGVPPASRKDAQQARPPTTFSSDASPHHASDNGCQTVTWSTPLRDLPPSVREWCGRQGDHSLRLALQVLQQRQLILSDTLIDLLTETPLMSVSIALCSVARQGNSAYTLHDGGGGDDDDGPEGRRAAAVSASSSTAYAVLRYWQPLWSALSFSQAGRSLPPDLLEADCDMSLPRLVALARVTRTETGAEAEFVYQCCGWRRVQRRPPQQERTGTLAKYTASGLRIDEARALHRRRARRRRGYHSRRESARITIAAGTIEDALAAALTHESPRLKLVEVLNEVDRYRRDVWGRRPLGIPASFLRLGGSKRKGAHSWLLSLDINSAWIGGLGASANGHRHAPTDDVVLAVLGRSDYDRDPYSQAALHSGILACVVKQALMTQARLSPSCGSKAVTQQLLNLLQSTLNPDALLPHDSTEAKDAVDRPSASALAVISRSTRAQTPTHQQPKSTPLDMAVFELALDALRMVMLSDKSHYSGSIAKELLLSFPEGLVREARDRLRKHPSFRISTPRQRIPGLAFSAKPFIFASGALKTTPRRCANAALLHSWAAALDATATAASKGVQSPLTRLNAFSPEVDAAFDITVLEQPIMDVQSVVAATTALSSLRSENASGVAGSEAALRRRIEEAMRTLRLPVLAWPQRSFALESAQVAAAKVRDQRRMLDRKRRLTDRGTDDDDDDDDDGGGEGEEDDGGEGDGSPATTAELYPSRTLSLYDDDAGVLEGIPVAGPPTPAEKETVNRAIADIRKGSYGSLRKALAPAYPSVFHHVDGTFNEYMWRYTLLCVYKLLLRVPGVAQTELRERVTASGLIGPRGFDAVIHFLCESGVVARCAGPEVKPVMCAGCPLVQPRWPHRRPRREEEEEEDLAAEVSEVYLTTTVNPKGLWDVLEL